MFSLSLRDVELLLAERGVIVSYKSICRWCQKFSQSFADQMRRRRPRPGDTWHLDEVFLRINGEQHYLWRAVDQHGIVLDILEQDRRNAAAAKRFFKRLLQGLKYKPRRLSAHGLIYGHFRPRRHLMRARDYRNVRTKAFRIWREETCARIGP